MCLNGAPLREGPVCLLQEEYRAELERQMTERKAREREEKERDRMEAAGSLGLVPSSESPSRYAAYNQPPPPAPSAPPHQPVHAAAYQPPQPYYGSARLPVASTARTMPLPDEAYERVPEYNPPPGEQS